DGHARQLAHPRPLRLGLTIAIAVIKIDQRAAVKTVERQRQQHDKIDDREHCLNHGLLCVRFRVPPNCHEIVISCNSLSKRVDALFLTTHQKAGSPGSVTASSLKTYPRTGAASPSAFPDTVTTPSAWSLSPAEARALAVNRCRAIPSLSTS